jgi:divalent metal cation (Fe/Co/Zn/Cd) transporter
MALGAYRLTTTGATEPSLAAAGIALASLTALGLLATRKRSVGERLGSRALRSDAHLSTLGAAQAAMALTGTGLHAVEVDWVDPVAAVVIGGVTAAVGVRTWRTRDRTGT